MKGVELLETQMPKKTANSDNMIEGCKMEQHENFPKEKTVYSIQIEELTKRLKEQENLNNDLRIENNILKEKQEELEEQVLQLKDMYDTISNAACWKITKPVRICLDILKTKKTIGLVYKGFSSLKNEGISATFEKTVTYIKSKKNEITGENSLEKRERESGYFSVYQEIHY